jgi:hypothetical protein
VSPSVSEIQTESFVRREANGLTASGLDSRRYENQVGTTALGNRLAPTIYAGDPATAIARRSRSQRAMHSSISVKRKVTVPDGRSGMICFQMCDLYWSLPIVACHA